MFVMVLLLTSVQTSTKSVAVSVPVQPLTSVKAYAIGIRPTAGTCGSNELPVTPEPLQVRPVGVSPVSATRPPIRQTVSIGKVTLTLGRLFTVMAMLSMAVQPFASVPVTVYVAELAGVKATPSLTPPLQ